MNTEVKELVQKFFEGSLNANEQYRLKHLLAKHPSPEYEAIHQYFKLIDAENKTADKFKFDDNSFKNNLRKTKFRRLIYSTSIAASFIIAISLSAIFWPDNQGGKFTDEELRTSIEITNKSISMINHYWKDGIQNIQSPTSFSKPFHDLSKLKNFYPNQTNDENEED